MGQWSKKLEQAQALVEEVWSAARSQAESVIQEQGAEASPQRLGYPVWLEDDSSIVFDSNFMDELTEAAEDMDAGRFEETVKGLLDENEE